MATRTLVLDASVGVKWFSGLGEANVPEARTLLMEHMLGDLRGIVPDLFFHEISNALVHKSSVSMGQIAEAITSLFELDLSRVFCQRRAAPGGH